MENTLNKSYKKNDVNLAEFPENKDVNLGESQKEDQQNSPVVRRGGEGCQTRV